jgi:DUF1365 family protein
MSNLNSSIYRGHVVHQRMRPTRHRLRYRVFSLLLDLDDLDKLEKQFRFLSYNRRTFYSIRDEDHGYGENIKKWIIQELHKADLGESACKIQMLCYPRILGYIFNPLTVFFCYRKNGVLGAIIYEVHNTFKERHCYVLAVNNVPKSIIKQHCNKQFYVSPFIDDACKYNFRIQAPGKKVSVVIREEDEEGLLLAASFAGVKVPLTDKNLIQTVLNYPLMTIKVIIGIHYEAIKLIFKRVPMFTHTPHAQKSMHSVNTLTPLRKQK